MTLSESHGPRQTGDCLYLIAKDILKECLNVRETILQSVRHKEEIFLSNNSYSLGKLLRQQDKNFTSLHLQPFTGHRGMGGISCFIASDPEFTGHNHINKKKKNAENASTYLPIWNNECGYSFLFYR